MSATERDDCFIDASDDNDQVNDDNNSETESIQNQSVLEDTSHLSQLVTPRINLNLIKFLSSSSVKRRMFKPVACKYCPR